MVNISSNKQPEFKRSGFKWTVNEYLALQREHELLGLSIKQISIKHERSLDSIVFKLNELKQDNDAYKVITNFVDSLPTNYTVMLY
jgi:hypothetical protein